ncbi:MAG: HNH endonuclease, partial [Candidatus Hodarchaeota archaeon]
KVRYRGQEYFIKGRMSTGYTLLIDIHGETQVFDHTPKMDRMSRLNARKTCLTISIGMKGVEQPIHPPHK